MTLDDNGPDGKTAPELFPAREAILQLCHDLRSARDPGLLFELPARTGARYAVTFHDPDASLSDGDDHSFFSGVETGPDQVLFLDPDNGFEPEAQLDQQARSLFLMSTDSLGSLLPVPWSRCFNITDEENFPRTSLVSRSPSYS